jgi:Pyruvate/2-oxoacid:ferredoxin oxidoreductase delta subunit
MKEEPKILFCHCARAQILPPETKTAVLEHLRNRGAALVEVEDLCELVAKKDPALMPFAKTADLRIAACYPRAVKWLFASAKAPLDESAVFLNMRAQSAGQITEILALEHPSRPDAPALAPVRESSKDSWLPWFPVIDFDRCTHCMQCLSFCLFNVFGVSADRKLQVENPENCKPNCPACARVCPETAILFPKHKAAPINGDVVANQEAPAKVDISSFLGGDIYQFLRDRNKRESARFSKERDPQTALEERRKCLAQLRQLGDIPPEVLMSLPEASEIKRRAEAAAARAKKALEVQSPGHDAH